jgi:hypothetical protein
VWALHPGCRRASSAWCFGFGCFCESFLFLFLLICFALGKTQWTIESPWTGEKRGFVCVVARVDGGSELWRPGSMPQSDWTDPLQLFELIVSMSQSDRWVVELSGACWGSNPTHRSPTHLDSYRIKFISEFLLVFSNSPSTESWLNNL